MNARFTDRLHAIASRLRLQRDWYLIALGAAIGAVTALGAIGFVLLLDGVAELATEFLIASPWWTLPLLPMGGALAAGILVNRFADEARGHGVPEVMDAVYRRGARIRRRVAIVKALSSILTIGSGGSAGAEGPIVQIGAAIGSAIGRLLRVSREQAGTLVGCGAAAGIASVFNAPIAGVFFVLEVLLRDFSLRTFTPVVIASVFSAATTQAILHQNNAIFELANVDYVFAFAELPSYLMLGLLCGLVAVLFTRMLYGVEDVAARLPLHPAIRPVVGGFLLGLLGLGFLLAVSPPDAQESLPPFFGNGYPTILHLLDPAAYESGVAAAAAGAESHTVVDHEIAPSPVPTTLAMLAVLLVAKLLATCFTLGTGGSGGVFAPSLFLGAAAGGVFGVLLESLGLLPAGGSPAAYALVGMAAVVAGTTHAPLTAILMIFEITRDVYVLLPLMLAAVIATLVAQLVSRDSIYTLKLRRRGVLIGRAADLTILRRIAAKQIPILPSVEVHPEDPAMSLLDLNRNYQSVDFPVVDSSGAYAGMVTAEDIRTALIEREAMPLLLVRDLMRDDLPTIEPDETLDIVIDKFSRHEVASLAMVSKGRVRGLITRTRLMRRYQQALAESA